MKKLFRKAVSISMILIMMASSVACGNASTKNASSTTTPAASTAPASAPASTPGESADPTVEVSSILDTIKERGTLKVATGTYVPFEYRDPETDKIIGFDIDFAQILADKLGVTLEVTDMTFTSLIPTVENGEYDLVIAAMYDTEERRQKVLMSDSYMETGVILVTQTGNEKGITSLKDCAGLKVGAKTGATSEKVAQEAMEEYGITYEIVGYEETIGCVSDLEAGRVDVVVNDLLNALELCKTHKKVEIVTEPFVHADLSIAVKKGNDELMTFINEAIAEYKADGTYDELYKKWLLES